LIYFCNFMQDTPEFMNGIRMKMRFRFLNGKYIGAFLASLLQKMPAQPKGNKALDTVPFFLKARDGAIIYFDVDCLPKR